MHWQRNRIISSCFAIFLVIFAVGFFMNGVFKQRQFDSCNIELTEEQLKQLMAEELFKSNHYRSKIKMLGVKEFVAQAQWTFYSHKPKPRSEADSEFDMTRYEVKAALDGIQFSMEIGKCRDLINISEVR